MSPPGRTTRERREAAEARRARRAEITDPDVVMEAAAAFIAVRSRSVEETRRRLRHLGYPPALVDEVVVRLIELGYLDDATFARAWVESRDRARPRGATALRRELQRKGVAEEVIQEALKERATATDPGSDADTERAAARRLIGRRAASLDRETDPRRRRQKAYSLLARNGFSPDVCAEVASGLVTNQADGPAEGV